MSGIHRQLEHAEVIWAFEEAHPSGEPDGLQLLAGLEAAIARARGLWLEQHRGMQEHHAAVIRRNQLRKCIRKGMLRHLAMVAKWASKERPELRELFLMPPHDCTNRSFLRAVKAMWTATLANRAELAGYGLIESLLPEFASMVSELEEVSAVAESGRREHTRATTELRRLLAKIATRVGRLEDVHLKRYENYPKLLAAFERERRISKLLRTAEGERGALRLIS